jgi:hypothetical protein
MSLSTVLIGDVDREPVGSHPKSPKVAQLKPDYQRSELKADGSSNTTPGKIVVETSCALPEYSEEARSGLESAPVVSKGSEVNNEKVRLLKVVRRLPNPYQGSHSTMTSIMVEILLPLVWISFWDHARSF